MSDVLRVFVASSTEQIEVAKQIATALGGSPGIEARTWKENTFSFSASYMESLEAELDRADFAVAVLTADDAANVRKETVNLPRDNVIFELGLFIGRLGRSRCFFFIDGDTDTEVASDLSGVKPVKFFAAPGDGVPDKPTIDSQAKKVLKQVFELGVRYKPSPAVRAEQEKLWAFSSRLAGEWWERMRDGEDDKSALSHVTVSVDQATNEPKLRGLAYGLDGGPLAEWSSVVTGVLCVDGIWKVYYRWEGEHDKETGQKYGGGGHFEFDDDALESGRGEYYDTNFAKLPEIATTRIKRFGLYRCEPHEIEIMKKPWRNEAKALIARKVGELDGR